MFINFSAKTKMRGAHACDVAVTMATRGFQDGGFLSGYEDGRESRYWSGDGGWVMRMGILESVSGLSVFYDSQRFNCDLFGWEMRCRLENAFWSFCVYI